MRNKLLFVRFMYLSRPAASFGSRSVPWRWSHRRCASIWAALPSLLQRVGRADRASNGTDQGEIDRHRTTANNFEHSAHWSTVAILGDSTVSTALSARSLVMNRSAVRFCSGARVLKTQRSVGLLGQWRHKHSGPRAVHYEVRGRLGSGAWDASSWMIWSPNDLE
jgi:hypothetical protein